MSDLIDNTKTGKAKQNTYRMLLSKHKRAMKNECFFEALMIDYSVLEDRLESFLWSAGVVNDIGVFRIGNRRNKQQLYALCTEYSHNNELPKLKKISGKIAMLCVLLEFGIRPYEGNDPYLSALHSGLARLDIECLKETLNALSKWCFYRNEVVHNAMNKDIYSLLDDLSDKANEGLAIARIIDNESRKLKRKVSIRKSVKMPVKK